jgi:C4-dicarboxylate-specific signal transduction histidine kinase
MVLIVALPGAAIMIYSGIQVRNHAINDAHLNALRLVDRIASEQQILAASALQLVVSVAQLPEVKEKDPAKVDQFLKQILRLHPKLAILFISDDTGAIWASAEPFANPVTIYDRRYFRNALDRGQLSSGEFHVSRILGKPIFTLGYPYKNNSGKIIGVIGAGIALEDYGPLLERTRLPDRSHLILMDHKGLILFSTTGHGESIGKQFNPVLFKKMLDGPERDTLTATGIDGDSAQQGYHISYQKLRLEGEPSPYMYVRVGIPGESVLSQANKQIVRNLSAFSLVLVLSLLLACLFGKRSIVDRIALLKKASRSLAEGNLQIKVSTLVKGGELGDLGESFDEMAQQLTSREKSLVEKQQLLEQYNLSLEKRVSDAVSDLRKKDQALIQQGRQAAMGEMIGNIAHQWRQPLNTLGLVVQELQMTYGSVDFNKESLEASVKKAMGLISHMSKTIDVFSNFFKPDKEKIQFSVNGTVAMVLSLIKPSLTRLNIDAEIVAIDDVSIHGYQHEYSQVLLNILLNCRDAFDGGNIGSQRVVMITVSTESSKSVVTIADNAGGIPEDVIGKVFDPYFTTKGPDKGTGIGLYMAKTIIEKNMNGRLTVRNTADGAEFKVEV